MWEVLELNGNTITPAQRVYSEVSGKTWWIEDKEKTVSDEWKEAYKDYLENFPEMSEFREKKAIY